MQGKQFPDTMTQTHLLNMGRGILRSSYEAWLALKDKPEVNMILSSNIWDCELNGTLTAIGLFWRFCKKEKHKWISTRLIRGEVTRGRSPCKYIK